MRGGGPPGTGGADRGAPPRPADAAAAGASDGAGPGASPAPGGEGAGRAGGGLRLARAIHFDESDARVYPNPARTGEWCVAGTFEFSDWTEADLVGRTRQAFANGWLGLETFGRVTFVAVARIEPREVAALEAALARHFVAFHGAPSQEAALPVARSEVAAMLELCGPLDPNAVLTLARELTEAGVREGVRIVAPRDAELAQIAVHGDPG